MVGFSKDIFIQSLVEDKFLCQLCEKVLCDPIQTYCGHRYCKTCFEDLLRYNESVYCNACKAEGIDDTVLTSQQIYPDRAIVRELNSQDVQCVNVGCNWTGNFRDYHLNHIPTCEYEMIQCVNRNGCNVSIQRGHLSSHLEKDCPMRIVKCEYCTVEVSFTNIEIHLLECPKTPEKCKFCGEFLPREMMEQHTDTKTGDCVRKLIACQFQDVGCHDMVEKSKTAEHNTRSMGEHLLMILQFIISLMAMVRSMRDKIDEVENVRTRINEHENQIKQLEKNEKTLHHKMTEMVSAAQNEKRNGIITGENKDLVEKYEQSTRALDNSMTVANKKLATCEGVVAVLNNQVEKTDETVTLLSLQQKKYTEMIEALERKVKAQDRIIALKDVAIAEQDLRIQSLEMASYDGVLVWKITDFARKRQDAISGRTTSIYSPCFYSSRHGYKMCARIYINGDGMGKGNHVSLFFVIMKGESDALLRWPFRQKVTMMWLDQNNRNHVIDAFRPDPTSSSFQRPKHDMNIASGCPLFMPLSDLDSPLHHYVKDDTAFIKIFVFYMLVYGM
ncbi:TNF receptor-associated factor 2-like [Saccoglossus kowalevskii]